MPRRVGLALVLSKHVVDRNLVFSRATGQRSLCGVPTCTAIWFHDDTLFTVDDGCNPSVDILRYVPFVSPSTVAHSSAQLKSFAPPALSVPPRSLVCLSVYLYCTGQPISSQIWPPSLEQGIWPEDYLMSDHGSLTTSFRFVRSLLPPPPPAAAATSSDENSHVSIDDRASAGPGAAASTERTGAGSVLEGSGDCSETRDWGSGDDGHYGLR